MSEYEIRFEFAQGYNAATVEADSIEAAMEMAKAMDPHKAEYGGTYELAFDDMESILVCAEDDELIHYEPETKVRLAAFDLLAACQAALLREDIASGELGDQLRAALTKAGAA